MDGPEPAEGTVGEGGEWTPVPDTEPSVMPSPPIEPTPDPVSEPEESAVKSEHSNSDLQTVAREVISGHWGRGNARKKRLEEAGFNAKAVNQAVSDILVGKD